MKIKIISDGTLSGTVVVDAETNNIIEGVHMISWSFESGADKPDALIAIDGVAVEIVSETDIIRLNRTTEVVRPGVAFDIDVHAMNLVNGFGGDQ